MPIRQWELARYLGITPQYVTRLLGQLEDEGLLLRCKGWLIIADPHRLWHRPDP
ncbi:MAG: helix-turn-helix domain-containing protein [Acidobacteria bacterium]|nr:MAG: helix-turn-helix domain-containing protein [Acidobacteriota bacterium]